MSDSTGPPKDGSEANEQTIHVADDFSRYPIGRYRTDAEASAEAFRDDLLAPALRDHDRVRVDLDGAAGYPSSWLEESFGGLVRVHRLDRDDLARLAITGGAADDEPRIQRIIRSALNVNGVPDRAFPRRAPIARRRTIVRVTGLGIAAIIVLIVGSIIAFGSSP